MKKENDYFLELMSNPTFSPKDFQLVGLDSENTGIQDASKYKKSKIIQEDPMFQTNGKFDESKFDTAYEQALSQYNDLARLTQAGKPFFRDDIFAPETLKEKNPEFTITRVKNPLRQQESFISFGTKEEPTKSVREIAESNPTYDFKTGKWTDSPNDTWFDNFVNPKVLAQWDFDADEDGNPTNNPDKVVYHKGERKINPITGTYYYETLGGRDIYGREVLSGFDTLTVDGSVANKFDFFDSDDIDKSTAGSMSRAIAQIAPVFIPYVGEAYIATRIAISMGELLPAIGKVFTGSDNEFLSKIEGINKAMSFSTSDYTQGSSEQNIEAHPWSMETGLKLISDVFTQLAEQRWIFKYGSALFSGVNPKIIGETKEAQAAREALIKANAEKYGLNFERILNRTNSDIQTGIMTNQANNFNIAKKALETQLKNGQEWSKKLSMAYMTGITTASSYGEAKQQGASDTEAALFALGYTAGEYALLNTEIGQWILPELKMEKYHNKAIVRNLARVTREAGDANRLTTEGKKKWYQSLFNFGKQLAKQDYSDSALKSASKMTISSMLSEGIEETSEELLLDMSKTIFNIANSLRGDETQFDDAWQNMATRYGLSFIGGTVGGGIASALPGYRSAIQALNMKDSDAYQEAVHIIADGGYQKLVEATNKIEGLGNKYLSTRQVKNSDGTVSYEEAKNYEDSQDYSIKQELIKQFKAIDDILNSEGAKISTDSLINDKLIRREMKYHALLGSNVLGVYTNEFNNLLSDLTDVSNQINELEKAKSGNNPERTDLQNRNDKKDFNKSDEENLSNLKKKQKKLRERLEQYKNGEVANEFISEALFELDTHISAAYAPTDFRRWAEEDSGKKFTELSDSERISLQNRWKESSTKRRDIIHRAYQVFKNNQKALSDVLKKHEEEYYQDNNKNIIKNLEDVFMTTEESISKSSDVVENASIFLPIDTRRLLWKGLLQGVKGKLDEATYKQLEEEYNKPWVSYNEYLGIKNLPNTIEELEKLSPEMQKKLKENLGLEENDIIPSDKDLINAIEVKRKEYNAERNNDFLAGWSVLLSNTQVQEEFANILKNAKYLTPTTKQYISDFINQSDITDQIKTKLNSELENINSSPIEEFLSNIIATLQSTGIDTTGMITDLSKFMNDLANSSNIEEFSYDSEMDQKIRATLDLMEIAHSHLEAAKTEISADIGNFFGYNATMNELSKKYPIKGQSTEKLVTIKSSTANSLMHDLAKIYKDLKFYQSIFNANTNTKLVDHIKTDLKLNTIYFNGLKKWSVEIPDDWQNKEDFINALNMATTLQSIVDNNKTSLTLDERKEMNKERLNIEHQLHELFVQNKDKDLKPLLRKFNLIESEPDNLLNSGITSQNTRDFIWHLADIAANDPILVENEFKDAITAQYAPIIGQEEAIKRAYSYLLNPQIFEDFAEAYNEVYKEQVVAKRIKDGNPRTDLDTDEYIMSTRHFLIEGIPGAGKSSATYQTLYNILKKNHPELLQKIWFVSNSSENAKEASSYMDGVITMSKDEYFHKIGIGYNQEFNGNGLLKIDPNDMTVDENGINHYKNVTINEGIEAPTLIFFDEVSSFSQQDLLLSEDFLKAKNTYAVVAGDFDQIGAQGMFKNQDGEEIYVRLSNSNFIKSWKLGSSMRSNNTYKSKDISIMRAAIKEMPNLIDLQMQGKPIDPIKFSYYESSEGLFGDKVVETNWENTVKSMLNSLKDGEKLNFIYDDESTKLYQTLDELSKRVEYKDKINKLSAKASQGQEGQYYIIELTNSYQLAASTGDIETINNFAKTIYTALSRAKQGSLLVGEYNGLFTSIQQSTLQKQNLSTQSIQTFGVERKNILEYALGDVSDHTKLNRDIPQEVIPPTTNLTSEDDLTEEQVITNNADKPSTLKNDEEGKLNILLHSFLCQETGCDILNGTEPTDENAKLKLGLFFEDRLDNLNGLTQLNKRSEGKIQNIQGIEIDSNGNIINGKDKALNILNRIRNIACYEESREEIVNKIRNIFNTTENISVDFIYKTTYRSYKNEEETKQWFERNKAYRKFYKGKSEYLAGIFNKNNSNDEIKEPKDQTIGILISLNGKQLMEVPLVKMTSPLTLLSTSEFSEIAKLFDGQDISKFKREIKKLLKNNSSIPHLKEFAKFLDLYSGTAYNNIVYLNKDFVLGKYKYSGITTTQVAGQNYLLNTSYYYDGEYMDLEDYRKKMPWRKMTRIFSSVETNGQKFIDINGHEIKVGDPFILVSDYYTSSVSDEQLLQAYIAQCKDNKKPKIRLIYVVPPSSTLEEYIFNLNNALTKNKSNMENVDKDLGNKITAFRLLQFALADGSKFREAFKSWNDNSPQGNKQISMNRLEAISNLIKTLADYERNEGRQALYELLNTPLKNVDKKFTENLKYNDGQGNEKWIMATNVDLTLRHVFQSELHKMLLSELIYGDSIKSTILTKQGNNLVFPEIAKNRIQAFIEDAKNNNWTGVQFHLKLKQQSTTDAGGYSFAEIDTELNKEYSVSGKPIMINGKLDATSYEMEVSELLDWILKGTAKDSEKFEVDDNSSNIFAKGDNKYQKQNLGRYMGNSSNDTQKIQFGKILNNANFEPKYKKVLTEEFNKLSENEQNKVLSDPREFIFNITGIVTKNHSNNLIKSNSTNLGDVEKIIYLNNGNIIFTSKTDTSKVKTINDSGQVVDLSEEEFNNLTKDLNNHPILQEFRNKYKKSKPISNNVIQFTPEEIVNIQDEVGLLVNNYIPDSWKSGNFERGISRIATDKTNSEINLMFDVNGNLTRPDMATLYALMSPKKYNTLKNNLEVNQFNAILQEISDKYKDFVLYVEQRVKDNSNSCNI